MILYAVINPSPADIRLLERARLTDVLISFATMTPTRKAVLRLRREFDAIGIKRIFLDCGAFTAKTKGVSLALAEYYRVIEWLQPEVYAAMDVIGDPEGTRANLRQMERDGYRDSMPIYTRGAPITDLRDLLDRGYRRIALGNLVWTPRNGNRDDKPSERERLRFIGSAFAEAGPGVRFHGFGVTNSRWLLAYPFYSADSSAALTGGGLGRAIFVDGLRMRGAGVNTDARSAWRAAHLTDKSGGSLGENRTARQVNNLKSYATMAARVTAVWEARGVTWDEPAVHS
jgi:hypothetical protein